MNSGPFLFLGSFVAMLLSWLGLIVAPQVQLRDLQPSRNEISGLFHPNQRLGLARQGAEVYRANACYSCHSLQVRQTGYTLEAYIQKAGNDPDALARALVRLHPEWSVEEAEIFSEGDTLELGPIDLQRKLRLENTWDTAGGGESGAKLGFRFAPAGPDVQRGWGLRATVARDYLFDDPVMIGEQRIGPDLSNIGARQPEREWHLAHLYAPGSKVDGSTMPAYRFLFSKRRVGDTPSPNALQVAGVEDGWEVVPTPDALALVAYLQSLKVTEPLYEAPSAAAE